MPSTAVPCRRRLSHHRPHLCRPAPYHPPRLRFHPARHPRRRLHQTLRRCLPLRLPQGRRACFCICSGSNTVARQLRLEAKESSITVISRPLLPSTAVPCHHHLIHHRLHLCRLAPSHPPRLRFHPARYLLALRRPPLRPIHPRRSLQAPVHRAHPHLPLAGISLPRYGN